MRVVAVPKPGREPVQRVEVTHADAPARTGKHPNQLEAGGGIVDDRERAHQVGDLRLGHQPANTEHVEAHVVPAHGFEKVTLRLSRSEQHCCGRRRSLNVKP